MRKKIGIKKGGERKKEEIFDQDKTSKEIESTLHDFSESSGLSRFVKGDRSSGKSSIKVAIQRIRSRIDTALRDFFVEDLFSTYCSISRTCFLSDAREKSRKSFGQFISFYILYFSLIPTDGTPCIKIVG